MFHYKSLNYRLEVKLLFSILECQILNVSIKLDFVAFICNDLSLDVGVVIDNITEDMPMKHNSACMWTCT